MSSLPRISAALAALHLAAACAKGRPATNDRAPADTTGARPLTFAPDDSLRVELAVPPRVRAGDAVRVTLRVTNGSSRATDLYLRGREPTFDVVVEDESGRTVWRRLAAETIPAILLLRPLGAGETMEVAVTWDQRTGSGTAVSPGRYAVRGLLLMEDSQRETGAVPLEITPR